MCCIRSGVCGFSRQFESDLELQLHFGTFQLISPRLSFTLVYNLGGPNHTTTI